MITNVPTVATLRNSSLNFYFTAWSSLIEIITDYECQYQEELGNAQGLVANEENETKTEYLASCQRDLQFILNIFQQSNEIALKSKISEISPYLLLVGKDPIENKNGTNSNFDFSDFVTADAKSLPKIVSNFTQNRLSPHFIAIYNDLRSLRNKITHLGVSRNLNIFELMQNMLDVYLDLWPERYWLNDRLEFSFSERKSFFHDYKHSSPEAMILDDLLTEQRFISLEKFKKLFHKEKSEVIYLCPICFQNGATSGGLPPQEATTAYKENDNSIKCLMCQGSYEIQKDISVECCDEAYFYKDSDNGLLCFQCGEHHIC